MVKRAEEMMLLTGKRKNKGFLLLEVMVSVTILSIALVLILNSFMRSVRAVDLSKDYFRAGLLLEEKMFEIYSDTDIEEGISEDIFTGFDNRFSWALNVTKLEEEPLKEVDLKVLWDERNKKQSLPVLTYLYTSTP